MMCDRVERGDLLGIPMPHPAFWAETLAFVYTGEEQMVMEQVKQNILYLGGKA